VLSKTTVTFAPGGTTTSDLSNFICAARDLISIATESWASDEAESKAAAMGKPATIEETNLFMEAIGEGKNIG
jgi:hypothetical protein